jgi:hypothetical protein
MNRSFLQWAAAAAVAFGASTAPAAVVFSLADDGQTLVRFNSDTPGSVAVVGAISGATTTLDGLDFRPADRLLYGYSNTTGGIYRVDTTSGAVTLVSTSSAPTTTGLLGIDFNPVPDRLRIVTANDENRRANVSTGATLTDGTLAYAAGDVNAGANPNVIDAAYTNSDNNPATGTTLYYIDYVLDILVSTTNPNGGILNTVGSLGVDSDEFAGFDIFFDPSTGSNTGFASLRVGGVDSLFTINLGTGAATLIGALGANQMNGLAVALPTSGTLALLGAAGLAGWAARRRRG